MNITMTIDSPNAPQEAVSLRAFLQQHDITGLEVSVLQTPPSKNAMSGGLLSGALALAINEGVKKVVGQVITAAFKHFMGRRADVELKGKCPDTGKEFSFTYSATSREQRDAIIAEFDTYYQTICEGASNTGK